MAYESAEEQGIIECGIPEGVNTFKTPVSLHPEARDVIPGHQHYHQTSGEVYEMQSV